MKHRFSESVVKAKSRIALSQPFYSVLMLGMRTVNMQGIWTFGTDGKCIYVNDENCRNWSVPHNIFGFAHECVHCMSGDLWWWRENGYDKVIANRAADYWINQQLTDEGFIPPKNILLDSKFKGWSKLQIYKYLLQNPEHGGGGQGGMGDGQNPMADDMKEGEEGDEENLKTEIGIRVKQAVQAAKAMGAAVPQWASDMITDLGKPKIPWQQRLMHMAQVAIQNKRDDWSYKRHNRRYVPQGIIAPSLFNPNGVGWVVFFVDTSGSMALDELNQGYAEAAGILEQCNPKRFTVADIDTSVRHVREFAPGDKITEVQVYGRGGTSFVEAFDWVKDNTHDDALALVIYLTDMHGTFPANAPAYPVLWLCTNDNKAPFGETIQIEI